MRPILAFLILWAAPFVSAQEFTDTDRFGKSCADVLAMGHDPWVEWYTDSSRGTQSTAGMAAAERIYSECLRERTKAKLRTVPEAEKTEIEGLETSLRTMLQECVTAGYALTGGGTMWIPFTDAAEVGVQEALWDVLNPDLITKKVSEQDAVWNEWKRATKAIKKNASDIDDMAGISGTGSQKALASLDNVSKEFAKVVQRVATRPAKVKKRVFYQCRRLLEMVSLSG